jgi:hypothetical protein
MVKVFIEMGLDIFLSSSNVSVDWTEKFHGLKSLFFDSERSKYSMLNRMSLKLQKRLMLNETLTDDDAKEQCKGN